MKRTIVKTVEYAHPVDRVWWALTDKNALSQWLMANDFEPTIGHAFQFREKPGPGWDGVVKCRVLELDPDAHCMVWEWKGGPLDTTVHFKLESAGEGTRLHFEHRGFEGLQSALVSLILEHGFKKMYRSWLPEVLRLKAAGQWTEDANPNKRDKISWS